MVALTRLADLESQMEFAYAKHRQLMRQREILRVQTETLRDLPVGVDAFKEDLEKLIAEMEKSQENRDADTEEGGLEAGEIAVEGEHPKQ